METFANSEPTYKLYFERALKINSQLIPQKIDAEIYKQGKSMLFPYKILDLYPTVFVSRLLEMSISEDFSIHKYIDVGRHQFKMGF